MTQTPYQEHLSRHSDIREHLGLLHGLAMQCKPYGVVELGFRTGVSTSAFLAAGARVHSVDIDASCKKHVRSLAHRYPKTFTFKVGDSRKVEIPRCQLLFIDTDHTFCTTRIELTQHAPMVDKWIVLHDTESFGRKDRPKSKEAGKDHAGREGVMTAVEEFLSHEPSNSWRMLLHLPNNNGLTILERIHR